MRVSVGASSWAGGACVLEQGCSKGLALRSYRREQSDSNFAPRLRRRWLQSVVTCEERKVAVLDETRNVRISVRDEMSKVG